MEEKKDFLDYLAQVFVIFGVTVLVIAVIGCLVGEEVKGLSSMFVLGGQGIPIGTVFEYLFSSACITLLRFLFFSEAVLKKMSIAGRTGGMVVSVIGLTGVFAFIFGWFPVDRAECWIAFLVCFALCFAGSYTVSFLRERGQNKRYEEALKRLQEERDGKMGE